MSTRKRLLDSWSVTYTSWPGATVLTSPGHQVSLPTAGGHTVAGLLTPGPAEETQVGAHPGNVRRAGGGNCRLATGRLLGLLALLLAAVVTARLLLAPGAGLLASGITAATSSSATMPSGGDGGDKGGVLFHCLVNGGPQVGLLAVHGPQLVSLGDKQPHILMVIFTQHDVQL